MILLNRGTEIIGRGSHWDKIAQEAIERKKNKTTTSNTFIAECGLGASGYPHIGSFADASRAFAVKKAVEDTGIFATHFYAYSDDLDGLRKVPAGMPSSMSEWIGVPVALIPDQESCHSSYGAHMTSLLLEALDEAGIEYQHKSAAKLYAQGVFADEISTIFSNLDQVGKIIYEETDQEKYLHTVPYHPICNICQKIYTTEITAFDINERSVEYTCKDATIGRNQIEGCGHYGRADYSKAEGKLSWKVEFASRWSALGVDFEPYGKDIYESVLANNRIADEVLKYPHPYQIRYEMFLDKSGTKISKSKGNVFTPQMWFKYGSPASLTLLTLKRIEGSRTLGIEDIPEYMDELHELEALHRGATMMKNKMNESQLKGLYQYCFWLNPPKEPEIATTPKGRYKSISYNLISLLSRYAPDPTVIREFIRLQLEDYGLIESDSDWDYVSSWIDYPIKWGQDFKDTLLQQDRLYDLDRTVREAIASLVDTFGEIEFTSENIQNAIFNTSKEFGIKPGNFFPALYQIYLGTSHGPKVGKIISFLGQNEAVGRLKNYLGK